MSLTIPQRVDKGIALLETYLPGGQWALKLNPKKLLMVNPNRCVLGQLAPHIDPDHRRDHSNTLSDYYLATGWIELDQDVAPVHEDSDWTADYGFQSAISEWEGDMDEFDKLYPDLAEDVLACHTEYELLNTEWIKRINQIREASDG